jgi:hypothetical protein
MMHKGKLLIIQDGFSSTAESPQGPRIVHMVDIFDLPRPIKSRPDSINGPKCLYADRATIPTMKLAFVLVLAASCSFAQSAPKAATVPITLDHNRIIIDVHLPLPDGSTKRVRAWVDNGDPDLYVTENVTRLMGLEPAGEIEEATRAKLRLAQPPKSILVGGMSVSLAGIQAARVVAAGESVAPGSSAQINFPSALLRHYDVLINYPDREFTIAEPGTLHFQGVHAKVLINPENGLIQVPSKIDGKSHNLALDVGASVSFLSADLIETLENAHPKWPHMSGAVGIANMWGSEDEPQRQLLRLAHMQYGSVFLTDVVVASFDAKAMDWFEKRAAVKTAGLIAANALLNYRIGIDYSHGEVYFDLGTTFKAPDMDVIGLILRPETDGRYTVLGVAEYEGKPSVPDVQKGDVLISVDGIRASGGTMGQVWSSLQGSPGKVRTLTFVRAGKQFEVRAKVEHFLPAANSASGK